MDPKLFKSTSGDAEAERGRRDHSKTARSQCRAKIARQNAQNDSGATERVMS